VVAVRGRRLRQVQIGPFAALFALYLILGVVAVIPRITADGAAYYAETRSLLFDGDLDLANEYAVPIESYSPLGDAGPRAIVPRDLDGSFNHDVNLGIVVLLGPFFLVAHAVAGVVGALSTGLGAAAPFAMDGFSPIYVLAVSFGSNALVAAGLGLLAAHLAPLVGRRVAIAAAAAIWLGSSLFYWSTQRPAHAHAPLVAVECLFVVVFLARGRSTRDLLAWLSMGALWGLLISVRPIAGFYAAVPAGYLLVESARGWRAWTSGSGPGPKRARDALALLAPPTIAAVMFLAGSLVGRLPQLLFAGDTSILGSGYYTDTSYLRTGFGSDPFGGLAALLFDRLQGTAWWVPIVPMSFFGLIVIWRRDRLTALACVTWAILIWGFAALLEAPARFGGFGLASRHLVEATPVYVIGLAGLLAGIRDLSRRVPPPRLPGRLFRFLPRLMAIAVATAVGWGMLTQLAGSVVDVGGRPPAEQLAAVVARPQVLGRLWYTPATSSAARGKVEIGGHLAAGILNADSAELSTALLEAGWLAIVGLGTILPMALVVRRLRRSDLREHANAGRPSLILTGRPSVRALGRGAALVAPVGLAGLLVLGLVGPVLAQPDVERDGQRLTVRTWDGRGLRRPSGIVTSITFGASPTGNAVVVPPRATRANSLSDPSTVTRGTFAPVGAGREALLVPPVDWDVITDVIIWFGPTFDPDAAAEVAIGPGDGRPAAMTARLTATDLALGAVALKLPRVVREMQDEPVLLTVNAVGGAPVPEVSIHGDGSLAWRLRGLRQQLLPVLSVGDDPLLPEMDPFYTLQESTSLVIDEAGARMRIGPWGPEQILRWSDHPGWLLPGPTTLPGTWGDSTAPGPTGEPLVVAVDAPFPISSLTAHAIVTGYANDPAASGRISIESSLDGLAWQSTSEGLPDTPRRQRALAGQVDLPPSTYRVLVRISLVGPPGSIGLNALWFDVDLAAPVTAIGTARSESIKVIRTAAARDYGPLRIEVAGPAGTANTALRAWGAASHLALQGPATVGGVAIAIALASTAVLALRRRSALVVPVGLAILAAIWVIAAIVTLPRVG
jgi:hypothetical protein